MRGCGADGKLDASRYTDPMPWIGAYVAAATLYCAGAMALDAYSGFRRRKFWFPTKFFSLNSTTLTMITIATKFPVDLNTSMPRAVDQLTKLSGTVLICTVTANFMPSLGDLDESQIVSNVVAMGILVITVVVNIGIQMGTGVIFAFLPEHVIVMILMLVVLVLMVSSALPIPTTKNLLEEQYLAKHREAESAAEASTGEGYSLFDKLKVYVKRHWLMAYTCSPQYVLGRSATCIASGAFSLVGALVLLQALLRGLLGGPGGMRFCSEPSDYGWSTALVLATQVAAVVVGTVAPAYRWLYAVNFSRINRQDWTCADEFTVEKYWVRRLKRLKEVEKYRVRIMKHLQEVVKYRVPRLQVEKYRVPRLKRTAHYFSSRIVALLVRLQVGVVLASKFVRLLSVVPVHWLQEGGRRMLFKRTTESPPVDEIYLKGYVLHLEGENDQVSLITTSKHADIWIQKGRDNQPGALVITLLREHSTFREGFRHAGDFDGSGVPSLLPEEPPNCWSLPLVTLAAVAAALPGVPRLPDVVDSPLLRVKACLRFVKLVEENLDLDEMGYMRRAAKSVWRGLKLDNKWLDRDLRSLAPAGDDGVGKKIAEAALAIAKQEVTDAVKELGISTRWPGSVMAANCMYRVCATIIQDYEDGRHQTDSDLYVWLWRTISDILGACLTNLPRTFNLSRTSHKYVEEMKKVRVAALVLGEAEKILEIVGHPEVACRYPRETQYLDNWKNRGRAVRERSPEDLASPDNVGDEACPSP